MKLGRKLSDWEKVNCNSGESEKFTCKLQECRELLDLEVGKETVMAVS